MKKDMNTKNEFNETGKFDFGKVGKRMPYTTPDGFFKDMEKNILEAVKDDTPQAIRVEPKKRPLIKGIIVAALAAAPSLAVILVLNIDFSAPDSSLASQTTNKFQEVDQAFSQLSSADQTYLLDVYQEDVFLNN